MNPQTPRAEPTDRNIVLSARILRSARLALRDLPTVTKAENVYSARINSPRLTRYGG